MYLCRLKSDSTMTLQESLSQHIKQAFVTLYNTPLETVEFQATRKDFEGDITVVTFSMLRTIKMNPAQLGEEFRGVSYQSMSMKSFVIMWSKDF